MKCQLLLTSESVCPELPRLHVLKFDLSGDCDGAVSAAVVASGQRSDETAGVTARQACRIAREISRWTATARVREQFRACLHELVDLLVLSMHFLTHLLDVHAFDERAQQTSRWVVILEG